MKLAIGHYHLNSGGVTRVIENQLLAMDGALNEGESHEALILYGGRSEGWPSELAGRLKRIRLRLHPLPEIDYDSEQPDSAGRLSSSLHKVLHEARFSPDETIVHLHNHSIGKNAALPRAVWELAEMGYGLLLQIHDFAEDQRPDNFRLLAQAESQYADWHGRLYPQAPNVHFAVLNGRDRRVLESVGIPPRQLHFLPNPVLPLERLPDHASARRKLRDLFAVDPQARFLLYPVRGIRRKNLGEALLHSVLAPQGTVVGLTLPPLNPVERARYEPWKVASERWRLPFRFDVGAPGGLSFAENLAASDAILTTSIAEGFGMVFLEAWLADRVLVGRDLPEITEDFTAAGLDLSRLSCRLEVPTDWIDLPRLRQTLLDACRTTIAAYERPQTVDLSEQLDAKLGGNTIDFGDLDESFQTEVIDRAVAAASARDDLADANPWIASSADDSAGEIIGANAQVVRREFSLGPSGSRLAAAYDDVLNSSRGVAVEPLAAPGAILDQFLEFSRFRLLRS
jgi:hypothetical protein